MQQPDELTLAIARHLDVDWQYVERVEASNTEHIAEIRSAGRKAGRMLDYKIATYRAPRPDNENRVTVIVALREAPNAEEEQRMTERARLLMDNFWAKHLPTADGEAEGGRAEGSR